MNSYKPQITLSFSEPLTLDTKRKLSCLFLSAAHLALGANLLSVYIGVFPVLLIPVSICLAIIEMRRKQPLSAVATKLLWYRIIFHITAIIAAVIIQITLPSEINPFAPWNLLIFTLIPLSIYDAFQVAEGKTGLKLSLIRK